jgi:hypothetical protein
VARCCVSVPGDYSVRTKCRGWFSSHVAALDASLAVVCGGSRPRSAWHSSLADLSRGLSAAEVPGGRGGVGGGWRLQWMTSVLRRPLVWIWALPVDVDVLLCWARCHHFCVVGRWLVEGSLSASPRASDGYDRCGGSSFPTTSGRHRRSIGQNPSRLWCRCQHRWRLRASRPSLEALCWDASCFGCCPLGGNISLSLRRSDDDGISAVSFLRASLCRSWTFAACGALTSWALGVWSANKLEA